MHAACTLSVWGIKEDNMALPRDQVADGLLSELDRFEQLIRPLDDAQWNQASRCAGWTVGADARSGVRKYHCGGWVHDKSKNWTR